jgi:hypothetical protein
MKTSSFSLQPGGTMLSINIPDGGAKVVEFFGKLSNLIVAATEYLTVEAAIRREELRIDSHPKVRDLVLRIKLLDRETKHLELENNIKDLRPKPTNTQHWKNNTKPINQPSQSNPEPLTHNMNIEGTTK